MKKAIWMLALLPLSIGTMQLMQTAARVHALETGIIRLHVYMTPPAPAKEIDFILEYDPEYVTAAFAG